MFQLKSMFIVYFSISIIVNVNVNVSVLFNNDLHRCRFSFRFIQNCNRFPSLALYSALFFPSISLYAYHAMLFKLMLNQNKERYTSKRFVYVWYTLYHTNLI